MLRYLEALTLGIIEAVDRAVFAALQPIRMELNRDLKRRVKTKREAERLKSSVVKDIERL